MDNLGGWWVGEAVGGCGWGWVPDLITPNVIPFWNRLTKSNHILKEKVEKFVMGKFLAVKRSSTPALVPESVCLSVCPSVVKTEFLTVFPACDIL